MNQNNKVNNDEMRFDTYYSKRTHEIFSFERTHFYDLFETEKLFNQRHKLIAFPF